MEAESDDYIPPSGTLVKRTKRMPTIKLTGNIHKDNKKIRKVLKQLRNKQEETIQLLQKILQNNNK